VKQSIIITGIPQIDRRLKQLEPKIQKKVIRKSMRDGMKLVATEVKGQVPIETGLTKSNVLTRAVKKKKRGSIEIEVRIAGGNTGLVKTYGGDKRAFYPAIVEYGRQGVAPNPFMRRSFAAKGEAARQVTIQSILTGVEEAVRSLS